MRVPGVAPRAAVAARRWRARRGGPGRAAGSRAWSRSASGRPGGTSSAAPCAATSGNPPTSVSTSGLPNASAVNSTPDWSISRYGQHDEVGARGRARGSRRRRRSAATKRTPGGARRRAASTPCAACRRPTARRPSMPRHASSRTSRPLYGRSSPKSRTTGPVDRGELGRQRRAGAGRVEVVERAVRDDRDLRRVDPELADEPRRGRARSARRPRPSARTAGAARRAGRAAARAAGRRARSARAGGGAAAGARRAAGRGATGSARRRRPPSAARR